MEDDLRKQLLQMESIPVSEARKRIPDLEKNHAQRRDWVWSRLGKAPLAHALMHLCTLATKTRNSLGGASLPDIAKLYGEAAWEADVAALDALKEVKSMADMQAVQAAVRGLYLALDAECGRTFPEAARYRAASIVCRGREDANQPGKRLCGGLCRWARWDLAKRLIERMRLKGLKPDLSSRWAGLPTVTATTKAAVSPMVKEVKGNSPGEDFLPDVAVNGQKLDHRSFSKAPGGPGDPVPQPGETGDPSGRGWTEQGDLDRLGHTLQAKLAHRVDEQLELILERVEMLDRGWMERNPGTDRPRVAIDARRASFSHTAQVLD